MTVLDILEKATEDTKFEAMKHNLRHGLVTPIVLVDSIGKYQRKLHLKSIGQLDFWNEISGWFHANTRCEVPHPVYDTTDGAIEIPSDVPIRNTWNGDLGNLTSPIVAGACLVDKDYNLYIVYGWVNDDGSSSCCLDFR